MVSLERMPDASGDYVAQKRQHKYVLTGIFNEAYALNYCLNNIPIYLTTEALFRQNVSMSTQGADLWYADVEYGPVPLFSGTWSYSFDTTGGTVHWGYSKECVNSYRRDYGTPAGEGGVPAEVPATGDTITDDMLSVAVGERELGFVEGTDVVVPACKLSYTYNKPKGIVTEAYVRYMTALTGIVNSVPWHGYAGGELLFLGMRGQSTAGAEAETSLTFEMILSPNVTNQSFGIPDDDEATPAFVGDQVTGIDKKGHHFLDIIFEKNDAVDARSILKLIRIHRMYEELDFAAYLGF